MGFLDSIEKMFTEHGSAAILKERIALLNDQHAVLERMATELASENEKLKSENEKLKLPNIELQQQKRTLEQNLSQAASNSTNPRFFCDHCGSNNLKRIGNKADPTFGKLGLKQALFSCNDCGKQSAFQDRS